MACVGGPSARLVPLKASLPVRRRGGSQQTPGRCGTAHTHNTQASVMPAWAYVLDAMEAFRRMASAPLRHCPEGPRRIVDVEHSRPQPDAAGPGLSPAHRTELGTTRPWRDRPTAGTRRWRASHRHRLDARVCLLCDRGCSQSRPALPCPKGACLELGVRLD